VLYIRDIAAESKARLNTQDCDVKKGCAQDCDVITNVTSYEHKTMSHWHKSWEQFCGNSSGSRMIMDHVTNRQNC